MSALFNDVDQQMLQLPTEIWAVILNLAIDRLNYPFSSRQILINVISTVSKGFYQLIKNIKIPLLPKKLRPIESQYGCTLYCGANGYASLLQYALDNGAYLDGIIKEKIVPAGHLDCLKISGCSVDLDDLNKATDHGQIDIVRYILSKYIMPTLLNTIPRAAKSGNVEILKLFINEKVLDNFEYFPLLSQYAAESGNLDMVKFMEQYAPLSEDNINHTTSVETLQYFLDKGFRLKDHSACRTAAKRGDVEYIRLALRYDVPLSTFLFAAVASLNDVEFMKELRAKGCPWDGLAIHTAGTKLNALKYLIENDCPWQGTEYTGHLIDNYETIEVANVTLRAALWGKVECVKYLMDHKVPWPDDLLERVLCEPTEKDQLPMVKFLHERGFEWTSASLCTSAARYGNLELLKYMHENDCPWDEWTCNLAAKEDNVECLKYALDNGCPWDRETMDEAASYGSLEALKLLFERGVPWNEDTCTNIMRNDKVELLKFAHENGAPWNENTIIEGMARWNKVLPCLKYAIENGCPWDPSAVLAAAVAQKHESVIKWLQEYLTESN